MQSTTVQNMLQVKSNFQCDQPKKSSNQIHHNNHLKITHNQHLRAKMAKMSSPKNSFSIESILNKNDAPHNSNNYSQNTCNSQDGDDVDVDSISVVSDGMDDRDDEEDVEHDQNQMGEGDDDEDDMLLSSRESGDDERIMLWTGDECDIDSTDESDHAIGNVTRCVGNDNHIIKEIDSSSSFPLFKPFPVYSNISNMSPHPFSIPPGMNYNPLCIPNSLLPFPLGSTFIGGGGGGSPWPHQHHSHHHHPHHPKPTLLGLQAPKPTGRRARKPGVDRKPRQAYSAKQLERLESEFKIDKYLSVSKRLELSKALNLTEVQIKTWFQNRRTKWKKQMTARFKLAQRQGLGSHFYSSFSSAFAAAQLSPFYQPPLFGHVSGSSVPVEALVSSTGGGGSVETQRNISNGIISTSHSQLQPSPPEVSVAIHSVTDK